MKAVLLGPFVGEFYWEAGRFAPILPYLKGKKYKNQKIKYIVLTREERFDLYGRHANVFVPLRIDGDYERRQPNCFRLNGLKPHQYDAIVQKFKKKYKDRYNIIEHIYPDVRKAVFGNKNQFHPKKMIYKYKPRIENYRLVEDFLPKNDKPNIVLAPRYRIGFKRNWQKWPEFYDTIASDKELMNSYNFIICGKKGEYIQDKKNRFYDMGDITLTEGSSLAGVLLCIMDHTHMTFGSQSAIPNISLLYGVEVLEFGCQKHLHTVTYNVKNTPITFFENRKYNIEASVVCNTLKKLLRKKRKRNENKHNKQLVSVTN